MNQNRPLEPRPLTADLTGKLDRFLAQHDFSDLYRSYSWKSDTYRAGFPDIFCLEVQVRESIKTGGITPHDIESVVRWGGGNQKVKILNEERFQELNACLCNQARGSDENDVSLAELVDKSISGLGATFTSKVLRFALPAQYGVIDTRLVRVFGKRNASEAIISGCRSPHIKPIRNTNVGQLENTNGIVVMPNG